MIGLESILREKNPQIFLLSETQLRTNTGINIEGYVFYGRKREGKFGGGVGILVRNDMKHNVACHVSVRNIEIMWVSLRRKQSAPLMIGVYYGKQETRTAKNDIEHEMALLKEEILEMKNEGEVLLTMDANAKIGILGEEISRNGEKFLKVIDDTDLIIMNRSELCKGKITRKHTKKETEISAIDFVLATRETKTWITEMIIDEDEMWKITGKNPSDHNTILLSLYIPCVDKGKTLKTITWNIKANDDKWNEFTNEIRRRTDNAANIITNNDEDMERKYKKFCNEIEVAARKTIGKTTYKENHTFKDSQAVSDLKKKKRMMKDEIQEEKDAILRQSKIEEYKGLQDQIRDIMTKEKAEIITKKFEKITEDKSRNAFWGEKRRMTRNPVHDSLVIKDAHGHRQFEPEAIKENMALYYESLYRDKEFEYHPYHDEIERKINEYANNYEYDEMFYNLIPSKEEVSEIISQKKNGKSAPDFPNEMLKRPGEAMVDFIYPLVVEVWVKEILPLIWNRGFITSLFKGKGDNEMLSNHRGITTSSSIGTIIDSLIDRRLEFLVGLTQAQGGGKKGKSPCDHLFILRAMIDISIAEKKPTYITFYDVSKAFDNVNNRDLLVIMWEKGLRGKAWRILKKLNENLSAVIKTRHGNTREIQMEIGGKQGSRLTGRMFAKMMDLLSEDLEELNLGLEIDEDLRIAILLWIDDVITCTEGTKNQYEILRAIDEFAKKHRIKWGQDKCNVMLVGKHDKQTHEWKIGEMTIKETDRYKYLGDIVCSNGKNTENLNAKKVKVQAATVTINTIASGEVLYRIETSVLLELHEKILISSLLNNSESWNLLKGEEDELEKIEVQALKHLFDLPLHTPTVAILFTFGTLYTRQRVDQKILRYLYRLLQNEQTDWVKKFMERLKEKKIGWYKKVEEILEKYKLSKSHNSIKTHSPSAWKNIVSMVIEEEHKKRLKEDCYKKENEQLIQKTKTKYIAEKLELSEYTRKPQREILYLTKNETKTLIIARYRMLDCGVNYKGTMNSQCDLCHCEDDENHRLNKCEKWRQYNFIGNDSVIDFNDIYSDDIDTLRSIIEKISQLWNTRNAHGAMRKD